MYYALFNKFFINILAYKESEKLNLSFLLFQRYDIKFEFKMTILWDDINIKNLKILAFFRGCQ